MTPNEYLEAVLADQDLEEGSAELKAVRKKRDEVEDVLRKELGYSSTIRYGGSVAKGTINRESYDLDIINYYPSDGDAAGDTLEEIYNNTKNALEKYFTVTPKGSALRISGPDWVGFHVDVVPGRFTDDEKSDAFLFRPTGEKKRLKTNLQKHIDHVRKSGVVDVIRLVKLWKTRELLAIKTFALELLVIEILRRPPTGLANKFLSVLVAFRDRMSELNIEDPANPNGNDLSEMLNDTVRMQLTLAATATLKCIDDNGWSAVFGKVKDEQAEKSARIPSQVEVLRAAAAAQTPSRPWCKVDCR